MLPLSLGLQGPTHDRIEMALVGAWSNWQDATLLM
jgi:hypothetical protein